MDITNFVFSPTQVTMNFFAHPQHRDYDPSSQNQESYNHFDSYAQSYAYPNPQFTAAIQPYSYQTSSLQPSQHQEQEPNPPGVSPPPPPLPETYRNSYYQYSAYGAASADPTAGPQPGAIDAGVHTVAHQPIVPSVCGGVGTMDGLVPRGDPQPHLGPNPNVSSSPFLVDEEGHALPMYSATPFQDQAVTTYGGLHFQGGPYQHPSQSYAEPYHGPTHTTTVRGPASRVHGHAKVRVQQKHAAQDPKSGVSSFSQTQLLPLKAPAPVSSSPKGVICELCKVECNTLDIFQQHLNGKKHKKKLKAFEDLQNLKTKVLSGQSEQPPTIELKPELVSQPDRVDGSRSQQLQQEALPSQQINKESTLTYVAGEKRKVEEAEPSEESGKMLRVDGPENSRCGMKHKLKGGKSKIKKTLVQAPKPKEVTHLVCELCNVKCESVVVFQSHLAGKKHRSNAKCFLQGQETFGLAIQAGDQNNASASTFISFQHVDQGFGGVASVQNGNINGGHGSTLGDNTRSEGEVEAIPIIDLT